MIPLVDLKANYLSQKTEIDKAVKNVIDNSAFIGGEIVTQFEKNFARFCEIKHAVGCSNGSSALHLALLALGIRKGDEVITVPNTFFATTEAISHVGGRIKFVDVEEDTALIDIDKLEKSISPRTKAVIVVNLFGQIPDMQWIKEITEEKNILLIEDSAQAHGSKWMGRQPGYYSDIATYSFFPAKVLGAFGDGGAVTTNNDEFAERIRLLANHGRKSKYEHIIEGYNYRLDTIQAAILDVKLKNLRKKIIQRRCNAAWYNSYLYYNHIEENLFAESSYYMYVIKVPKNRQEFISYLQKNGISSGIHYPICLHLQPAYTGLKVGDFPIAEKLAKEIVSIPIYPELVVEQLDYVVRTLNAF